MEWGVLPVFFLVYLGMMLGSWPGLVIDRTGIALLGAIAIVELKSLSLSAASQYIDFSALGMLFSFMIISAQFYYSGFYAWLISKIENRRLPPSQLLLWIILVSALLSAVLLNDIVCLALTPLIIRGCANQKLNPIPHLLGLVCASNIGSAITLVGNPQNLLIGQSMEIPFGQYMKYSSVPCLAALFATWLIIRFQTKNAWNQTESDTPDLSPENGQSIPNSAKNLEFGRIENKSCDVWQSIKGVVLIFALLMLFFLTNVPRDKLSLIAAGCLLLSRRMASFKILGFIDWQLLVLFIGLFVINRGVLDSSFMDGFHQYSIHLQSPGWIFVAAAFLSNILSNVPAVMMILPFIHGAFNASILALSSTLAGNLLVVGSIANLIVIYQASRFGIRITWKKHIRVGVPVTLASFALVIGWLYLFASAR